jgi:hypothetical protein
MSHNDSISNSWFEDAFETRLAQIEEKLKKWGHAAFHQEDANTHDDLLQRARFALWSRFSEDPEGWSIRPNDLWLAYAKAFYRWGVVQFHRDGNRKLGLVASDMECIVNDQDITDDEAVSMVYTDHTTGGHFAYPREIQLADLRIDLEAAIQRGMRRLCATQRRDMPLLISDMLEGYTLEETCERHGWTSHLRRVAVLDQVADKAEIDLGFQLTVKIVWGNKSFQTNHGVRLEIFRFAPLHEVTPLRCVR